MLRAGKITPANARALRAVVLKGIPPMLRGSRRLPSNLPDGDVLVKIRIGTVETQDAALAAVKR